MMLPVFGEFLVRKVRCLAYCPLSAGADSRKLVIGTAFSPHPQLCRIPFAIGASAAGNSLSSPCTSDLA